MPPPSGILRPSAAAIAQGLSFAQAFQNGPSSPFVLRGTVPGVFASGGVRNAGRAGVAMMGANGYWGTDTGVTYSINPTAGTLLVFTTPDFASNAGSARMAFSMANNFPTGPGIEWLKFLDGNCYVGKIDSGDKRVVFSNSGLWAAGDDVVLGYTWDASGQKAFVNGIQRGSNASTGSSSTAGQPFNIGHLSTDTTWRWNQTSVGAIYYALIFDRALSPQELASAQANPWWWVEQTVTVVPGNAAYSLTVDPLSYEYAVADVGLTSARGLAVDALAYEHTLADVALSYRQTSYPLDVEALAYRYRVADVGITFTPAQSEVDTHDGFKRRSRRERALEAAAKRLRDEARDEAIALRLQIEAAMGAVAEAAEEAPESVAEAVPPVVARAEAAVARLAPVRPVDAATLAEAHEIATTLRTLVEDMERARVLAEDDEEVMMLLRAFR